MPLYTITNHSAQGKVLAEGNALSRCFEAETAAGAAEPAGAGAAAALSTAAWERCVASVCGFRGCIMGEGVYAPQLAAWQRAARSFQWVLLPGESLRNRPAEALGRIFTVFKLPQPPDVTVVGFTPAVIHGAHTHSWDQRAWDTYP